MARPLVHNDPARRGDPPAARNRDLPRHEVASPDDRSREGLTRRERQVETAVALAFVAAAAACMALLPWDRPLEWDAVAVAVVVMAVAGQVRFTVPSGYTAPIALVFVPVLFIVPLPLVPALTAAAFVLGVLPAVVSGRMAPSRLVFAVSNAYFSLGPVVVLALWGALTVAATPWWALVAALAAQIAVDFLASSVREGLTGGAPLAEQAAEMGWVGGIDVALSAAGLVTAFGVPQRPWLPLLLLPLVLVMHLFAAERRRRLEQMTELNTAYRGTAQVLGDMVEADDAYTGQHSRDVVDLSLAVADALGLPRTARRNVEFGALLHDVGKVAIPKSIIRKPGPLDDAEWAIVKTHTIEGQQLLDRMGGVMRDIGRVVRSSHERWDGRGYPDGLAAGDIPLEARIIATCDTFSAMTTTRPYRQALTVEAAVAELERCAGSQLDPAVVSALLEVVRREPRR